MCTVYTGKYYHLSIPVLLSNTIQGKEGAMITDETGMLTTELQFLIHSYV